MGKIKCSIVTFFSGGKLKQGCSINTKGTCISAALYEDCIALEEFLMLNSECASLEAFPSVGTCTKQESISSQPGCLFSQNHCNLMPLETTVPL